MVLALWTAQGQGDLLRLPWAAYDGKRIRLQQSKIGRCIVVPAGEPLKAPLAQNANKTVNWAVNCAVCSHPEII